MCTVWLVGSYVLTAVNFGNMANSIHWLLCIVSVSNECDYQHYYTVVNAGFTGSVVVVGTG